MTENQNTTVEEFADWMNESLVHYSNKVVNSGLPGGGVRLDRSQAIDVPHICGRSLLFERIEGRSNTPALLLDYISVTDRFKYIRGWLGEDVKGIGEKYKVTREEQSEIVSRYKDLCDGGCGKVCQSNIGNKLPFRLKQLLIPRDGDYVSVTPLPCLPVGKHLKTGFIERDMRRNELLKASKKKSLSDPEKKVLIEEAKSLGQVASLANFAVGGANAQNVGGRIFEAYTRPILCRGLPRMDSDLRKAFAIAHNGICFRLPRKLIEEYQRFLENEREKITGHEITWTQRKRETEAVHLDKLFGSWEHQATAGQRLLGEYEAELPDDLPCFDGDGGDRMKGWLKPDTRTHQWRQREISHFIQSLRRFVIGKGSSGDPVTLQLNAADIARIRSSLLEGRVV